MVVKKHPNRPASVENPVPDVPQIGTGDSSVRRTQEEAEPPAHASYMSLLTTVTWCLAGPMVLFVTLFGIVNSGSGWLTVLDAVYLVTVALILGCRWLEQRSGRGMTLYGQPSTWKDFRRYAVGLVILTFGAWVVANLLGNHVFQGGVGL